ncbi:hypothetical protein KO317_03045 [Candidatus Micrarchaeota archaeon]|nr:hypothetical protein [Candidatus Micrarchaeota archaeon]
MIGVKTRKGQYFSFDAITSIIIFMITMSLIVTYWFTIQGVMTTNESDAYRTAIRISDTLVSRGDPTWDGLESWVNKIPSNPEEIMIAGFAENTSILNQWMILDLEDLVGSSNSGFNTGNYNNLKRVLRTGYDVNIKIYREGAFNGGEGTPWYNIGLDNYTNVNTTVASYNRIIIINTTSGNLVRGNLQINIWDN